MADGFTEDWLQKHQARMAGLKAHSVATPAPSATTESTKGPLPGSPGDEGMGGETVAADRSPRFAPHAGRRMQKQTSRTPSAPFTAAKAERSTGTGGRRQGETLVGDRTGGKQRPEEDLQIAVAELLDLGLPQGWRWWHTPNQRGTRKYWEQKLLKALGVKAGIQDVTIVGPDPRLVIIELKSDTGSLSKAQREWRDFYWSIGVPWFLARSVEDVIAACQDAGVPLRVRVS